MKICIDVRCLMEGRRTGVEEYTLGLLDELFKLDKKNEYVLFLNSWKEPNFDFEIFSKFKNVTIKRLKIPNKIMNLFFWYLDWPKIDRIVGGADVVFMPNISFASVSNKTKLIITMHDLSFERYPEYFSFKRRLWHIFINPKKIAKKANKIIAVSCSTKNDLISLYGIDKNKIEVIYSAINERFKVIDRNNINLIRVKERYSLPYKFMLFLGTIEPRKNIIGIVRAYNIFREYAKKEKRESFAKVALVIAGEKGWSAKETFLEIERSPFKNDIHVINFVADEDKEFLYNLASLFIYPSFFEGFGFPPLEALNCGVPVISSNNSSLPEVVGESAVMIDPDKPDEIFEIMKEIFSNQKLRENLIEKGIENSKKFSWEKSAVSFLGLLRRM